MELQDYISRMDEACGEGRDFIIILRSGKREEAIRKVLNRLEQERVLSGVMTKGKYKDRDLSVFVTGKIMLKGLNGEEEAKKLLTELLS